ncbi:hypothetical protein Tco_0650317 [Tanacetum coccineum]
MTKRSMDGTGLCKIMAKVTKMPKSRVNTEESAVNGAGLKNTNWTHLNPSVGGKANSITLMTCEDIWAHQIKFQQPHLLAMEKTVQTLKALST